MPTTGSSAGNRSGGAADSRGAGRLLGAAATQQFMALFGTFSIGLIGYIAVVVQVILIALVAAYTSRTTVNRTLETIQ